MKIIVGLGNPGDQYEGTRHNVGFMAVDELALRQGLAWGKDKRSNSQVAKGEGFLLVKPLSFMNRSGQSVRSVLDYYKLIPRKMGLFTAKDADLSEILTVIHDDLDIDLGKYKVAAGSSSAGHNGVSSVIEHLKTKNFTRARIGINTDLRKQVPAEKFVLDRFSKEEMEAVNYAINGALKELE
jgi:peptidyl-tRNA hydrolase, PTH1 family